MQKKLGVLQVSESFKGQNECVLGEILGVAAAAADALCLPMNGGIETLEEQLNGNAIPAHGVPDQTKTSLADRGCAGDQARRSTKRDHVTLLTKGYRQGNPNGSPAEGHKLEGENGTAHARPSSS